MSLGNTKTASIIGVSLFLGLTSLGLLLGNAAIEYKEYERTVSAKGLSEREYKADIVIWPIQFVVASNDLTQMYRTIDSHSAKIGQFLEASGISAEEISFSTPGITDKSAQQWGGQDGAAYRYTASQSVTVYSENIDLVREVMGKMSDLGKSGIVFTGSDYDSQTEYLFTRLNEVKPDMIEEATRNAREVAEKFASDSESSLGKIKSATQGQFSIQSRDRNNPHIKKLRVVSTVVYYLSD